MIKKLKLRYLITNMALLSGTLLIFLGAFFAFLYHSEVNSSYRVMREMLEEADMPHQQKDEPAPAVETFTEAKVVELADDQIQWWQQTNGEGQSQENQSDNQWTGYPWVPPIWYFYQWPSYYQWNGNNGQNGNQEPNAGQYPYWGYYPPSGDQQGQQQWGWEAYIPEDKNDSQPAQTEPNQPQEEYAEIQEEPVQTEAPKNKFYSGYPNFYDPAFTGKFEPKSFYATTKTDSKDASTETEAVAAAEDVPGEDAPEQEPFYPDEPDDNGGQDAVPPASIVSSLPAPRSTEPETQTTAAPVLPIKEGQYVHNALIAQMDENGNLESYAGAGINANDEWSENFNTINQALDKVRNSGQSTGILSFPNGADYRYIYMPNRMILLDRTQEQATINKLIFIFLLIGLVGLVIMFGISLVLANWTVTPIATAWEKQKQFVADASHELKTPLAVISANTEVVLANPGASVSGQSKWLNYIQSETMRMSKLITSLLSIARMDHPDTAKSDRTVLPLSETVSNICLQFEPIIYENGKTLNTVIQRKVMINGEEDNIKQLLSILLDNAILHSVPKAQITVSLSKDTQGKIRLAVANTAKDIPPEQLAHLFDRFYRIDTEGSPNGSGLGLSIAKSIVNQMGGKISVTSENQLVTFTAVFST